MKFPKDKIKTVLLKNKLYGRIETGKRIWTHPFPSVSFFSENILIDIAEAMRKYSNIGQVSVSPCSSEKEFTEKLNKLVDNLYIKLNK